jgi:hypothetical protein
LALLTGMAGDEEHLIPEIGMAGDEEHLSLEIDEAYHVPKLLCPKIDKDHRSYLSAVKNETLCLVKYRVSSVMLPIHPAMVPRLVYRFI